MEITKNVYTVADVVKKISSKTGLTQKDARTALDALREVIVDTFVEVNESTDVEIKLMQGISVVGAYAPSHEARNPQNGETVVVPGKKRISGKFAMSLKNDINA